MRYVDVENITFTDANGKVYTIKDRRKIPTYTILTAIGKNDRELADEICIKKEIYGEFNEDLAYRIYEANIVKLIEARFDFSKMKQIQIPTIED